MADDEDTFTLDGTTFKKVVRRKAGRATIYYREVRPSAPLPGGPLGEALKEAIEYRWRGRRSALRNASQATAGVLAIQAIAGQDVTPDAGTKAMLRQLSRRWLAEGLAPTSCRVRLSCLSPLGIDVKGCRPTLPRKLQWYLSDADEAKIVASLLDGGGDRERSLAQLICWTTRTGLRIEESLRLTWADIRRGEAYSTVTVPGLKTAISQATLVLSADASAVLDDIPRGAQAARVFALDYWQAGRLWAQHRQVFGLSNPKNATLKALRRSAARHLHAVRGMPLDMLRQYFRHGSVNTTQGYLRLTGGYGEAEMAKWL